ncbi:MAG: aminopeptidase P family protein [Phycisphaerae bacterium]|nr:aminopeptidase P family protein [Phycisphaerae bacterium]
MPSRSPKSTHRSNTDQSSYRSRIGRVRRRLGEIGCAALLVTNPKDVAYLTGFLGGDSYLLVGATRSVLVSDFRYAEEVRVVEGIAEVFMRKGPLLDAATEVVRSALSKSDPLAVQDEHVTVAQRRSMGRALKGRRVVGTNGLVSGLRMRKDASEVAHIRRAIRIGEAALSDVLEELKPGMTELEIAGRLEWEMKRRGSVTPSFSSIVCARTNGSRPHHRPGTTRAGANSSVLIDWGAMWEGYHGDMTRTIALGRWPSELRDVYGLVRDAHEAAAAALAPGRTTVEIDAAARDVITGAGYGERFGHGLGHGIGLDIHESPMLSSVLPAFRLEAGHVVTIEPGVYLPGVGGVRIENDYLITERGAENLCRLPTSLEWATR